MPALPPLPRAWRVRRLGDPEHALTWEAADVRPPGPREVQVAVAAAGVNFPDLLVCAGLYQERPAVPFTPGFEAAGTVVDAGADVPVARGDRVVVIPELPEGAMQELLTVPATQLFPIPEGMPWSTAAVLPIAYQTAHVALFHRASLRTGDQVLVTGAAGGVGMAAVQLAVAGGARVVAMVHGEAKAASCARWGAHDVIDLSSPHIVGRGTDDVVERVMQATGGRGADVVVDVVGGELFRALRRCVAFEGRMVVVGFTSGSFPSLHVNHALLRNYSVVGLHLARYRTERAGILHAAHADLVHRWRRGEIAPHVHAELPIEQAPEAMRLLAERQVVGRVVLRTSGSGCGQ